MELKTKQIRTITEQKIEVIPNTEDLSETRGFAKRFPKVKDRVLSILRNDEYARKNYLWLCLRYCAKCGHIKIIIPMEDFQHVNSPETITRATRKLFEEAKTNPKLKVLLKEGETISRRKERQKEISNYFSFDKYSKKVRFIK